MAAMQHLRAVVVCASGGRGLGPLLRGLAERGVAVSVARSAAEAIVALGVPDRAGLLVVPGREPVERWDELLSVVRRCFPEVLLRRYCPGGGGIGARLVAVGNGPPRAGRDRAGPPAAVRAEPEDDDWRPAIAEGPLVSDEEMAMLLGPRDGDEPPDVAGGAEERH